MLEAWLLFHLISWQPLKSVLILSTVDREVSIGRVKRLVPAKMSVLSACALHHLPLRKWVAVPAFSFKSAFLGHESQEMAGCPPPLCFQMGRLAHDQVEMAPTSQNEWMGGEFQEEAGNAEMLSPVHTLDVPWLLVADTRRPHSWTVCFVFAELLWKPSCLPPSQWPRRGKGSQTEIKLCAAVKDEEMPHDCFWIFQRLLLPGNGIPMTGKAEGWWPQCTYHEVCSPFFAKELMKLGQEWCYWAT